MKKIKSIYIIFMIFFAYGYCQFCNTVPIQYKEFAGFADADSYHSDGIFQFAFGTED